MELDELNKLEEKVKNLVENLKHFRDENEKLKTEIQQLQHESSINNDERTQIKSKVNTLIEMIDSLEKE
ncbi:MAG: cell division protein ZapB [Candidatus Omnitrophota bacterium]